MELTTSPALFARMKQQVDETLALRALPPAKPGSALIQAMRDAVLASGKRLRPLLVLCASEYCGGKNNPDTLDVACAFELIHTASLIFDDLPSMDDASLRRGAAALHLVYGEHVAVLAAIALINRAYQLIAACQTLPEARRLAIISLLAQATGEAGLSGGQYLDLQGDRNRSDPARFIYLKTGILFAAAAVAGAHCAGRDSCIEPLKLFAQEIGQGFQLLDDLADQDGPQAKIENELHVGDQIEQHLQAALTALQQKESHLASLARLMLGQRLVAA